MSGRVIVVGAGVAGTAAAWSARRLGRAVTIVSAGAGASALGGGAVDDAPWERLARASRVLGVEVRATELAADVTAFAGELTLWDLPAAARVWVATAAGLIRPARGRDRALLEIGALAGREVLLPRADRAGWDADAIAATLAADPLAKTRQIGFRAIDLPILRFEEERRIADGDLAARHDDEGRLAWLATRLREGLARHEGAGAVLLGPWLGARAARAEALSRAVNAPVGEVLVGAGSPAGLRFEAARDRLLDAIGARVVHDRAVRVEALGEAVVTLDGGGAPLTGDAVVLAIGGLVGGGVVYAPPEHEAGADMPAHGSEPFVLSLDAPVSLSERLTSSLHGPELDLTAWPSGDRLGALEAAGVRCEGVRAATGIAAAGDVIAGRPRTLLEAVASGIAAGEAAAQRLSRGGSSSSL